MNADPITLLLILVFAVLAGALYLISRPKKKPVATKDWEVLLGNCNNGKVLNVIECITDDGGSVFSHAYRLLLRTLFSPKEEVVAVGVISVGELGLENDSKSPAVFDALQKRGLYLCSPEVALALVVQRPSLLKSMFKEPGDAQRGLALYMDPVGIELSTTVILCIGIKVDGHPFVDVRMAGPFSHWHKRDLILFVQP